MKSELFYYYNRVTNKHFFYFDNTDKFVYLFIGNELMRKGQDLTPFVFVEEERPNMTSVLRLDDNNLLRVGKAIAEKVLSLLIEISPFDTDEMSYKQEMKRLKERRTELETELERGYTPELWTEYNVLLRKIEVLKAKKDGSFYQEIPQEFKIPRTNK